MIYFDNIAKYVRDGGAVWCAGGPITQARPRVWRTPLEVVLPAEPMRRTIELPFFPQLSDLGKAIR